MDVQSAYRQEQDRLEEAIEEINRQMNALGPKYYGDDFTEQVLDARREAVRKRLELLKAEPYFGRLDFQEEGREETIPLYIGKRGMELGDAVEPYIIDWRAPVASLFYSFTGGEEAVQYEAPYNTVKGLIHLKRNLVIREQMLQRVVDSFVRGEENLGIADEFLLYRLGENKDNRLRDIVSTIQVEQDLIIRAQRHTALIVQGAAGSGKTTVALHRLAYLLYEYREQIRAEKMIIFAPNAMFLEYISGVLPELGVGNIHQTTFAEWALERLDHKVLMDEKEEMKKWFSIDRMLSETEEETSGRLKGSLHFKRWIDEKITGYINDFLPALDFVPWDGECLPREQIHEWFFVEYRHYPLEKRRERLEGRLKRWLEIELNGIKYPPMRKEITKSARQKLKAYVKRIPVPDPFAFYRSLFETNDDIPKSIRDHSLGYLRRGVVCFEDLAPMLWIQKQFEGSEGQVFDHVVIDEAQDISPFMAALLNDFMTEPSFTILGDLGQGIHEYRGISSWDEIMAVFNREQVSYHQLRQSYRFTTEIIEFANHILAQAQTKLPPAQPVFRSGDPVTINRTQSNDERNRFIKEFITDSRSNGMQTIAVIGRTGEECRQIYKAIELQGIEAHMIEEGQKKYRGGISVVPVYLSKGLEFDAVILFDVDDRHYKQTPKDAKLLYVGCTRALHQLSIVYSGEISSLIRDLS
jgi:DNA helicase-2/ATP-dependent DNA helicase PcrA